MSAISGTKLDAIPPANNEEKKRSQYGKGLCYCLALFVAHAERIRDLPDEIYAGTWFNSASDHLYELQVESAPPHLRDRLSRFRDCCIDFGHGFPTPGPTRRDVDGAIQEAKDLVRLIEEANGVPVLKGAWE